MANAITLFKKYIDLLDDVYMYASKTAVLESDSSLMRAGAAANEIVVPKISMDGLGSYDRNSGYKAGSVTLTNETIKFNFDRGRQFSIDAMDNEETAGVAFGRLSSEFIRTKVTPELDAFRFATYSAKAKTKVEAALDDGATALKAIEVAVTQMDNDEVPEESRYLFITADILNSIASLDTTKSREMLGKFDGRIIKVPKGRFFTAISQKTGGLGETQGGYEKAPEGAEINFMIVEKTAVMQYTKHIVTKAYRPEENQDADAWKFNFRSYGLAAVYENKTAGIYLHHKANA